MRQREHRHLLSARSAPRLRTLPIQDGSLQVCHPRCRHAARWVRALSALILVCSRRTGEAHRAATSRPGVSRDASGEARRLAERLQPGLRWGIPSAVPGPAGKLPLPTRARGPATDPHPIPVPGRHEDFITSEGASIHRMCRVDAREHANPRASRPVIAGLDEDTAGPFLRTRGPSTASPTPVGCVPMGPGVRPLSPMAAERHLAGHAHSRPSRAPRASAGSHGGRSR